MVVGCGLVESISTSMGVSCGLTVAGGGVIMVGGRTVSLVERFAVARGLVDGGVVVAELSLGVLRGVVCECAWVGVCFVW